MLLLLLLFVDCVCLQAFLEKGTALAGVAGRTVAAG